MARKSSRNTKSKIVSAAWKLFYEQGYDDTTIDEIIDASGTSKGSFYHYFEGKDALLGSLAYLFDEKYEQLAQTIDEETSSVELLLLLNRELFGMIEQQIDMQLLTRLYSTQLTTRGEQQLLDPNRVYYKLLRKIVSRGQARGDLTGEMNTNDIVRYYALCERSLLYDWCLCKGEYSLLAYAKRVMPMFLEGLRPAGSGQK